MKKIIVTMLLLAVTALLTAVLASCSCGSDAPAVTSTTTASSLAETSDSAPATTTGKETPKVTSFTTTATAPNTTTVVATSNTAPQSSSDTVPSSSSAASTLDTTPESTTKVVKLPAEPIAPSTEKADESGKISLSASDIKTGLLLSISDANLYDVEVNPLFNGDDNTTADDAIKAGYTHISTMFKTIDNKHFLRNEAILALAAMIQTFDSVAGTDSPFRVEGYTADMASALNNAFITGNVFKLRTYSAGNTYGLNYSAHKVMLDGNMVSYDKWFAANAATYGFIWEGLVGSENNKAGQFRYVGTIHAAGIQAAGSLDAYIEAIKAGTVTSAMVGGEEWKLSYVKLSQGENIEHYTEVVLGANATYTISGDNKEGVIVAIKVVAE